MSLTPPIATPTGQSLAWVRPTAVSVLSSLAVGSATPGVADGTNPTTGTLAMETSWWMNAASAPGDPDIPVGPFWGLVFSGFSLSDAGVPDGVVIRGLYACANLSGSLSGGLCALDCAAGHIDPGVVGEMWNWDGIGGSGQSDGFGPTIPNPGSVTNQQYNTGDISAFVTYSPDLSLFQACVRWFETLLQTGFSASASINDLAIAVYYETPAVKPILIGHGANLNAYDNGGYLAPAWPPGNGELLYDIEPARNWARANGISISLNQDSQRTAKDMLDEFLTECNSAPVYSGDTLKTIPYDEVSWAGNGAIYIAPTSGGPKDDLDEEDFTPDGLPKFVRKRRASCDNTVSIEHVDRALDYEHNVTSEADSMSVAINGPRKGGTLDSSDLGMNLPSGTKSLLAIHERDRAQKIASILAKRSAAGANEWQFKLKAERLQCEAMDLYTISNKRLGLVQRPVIFTNVKENKDGTFSVTADEFIYGLNHPDVRTVTNATGTLVQVNVDPGLVNAPIIFEPPAAMLAAGSGNSQAWFLVSGADPNYGGCVPFVSVDGGAEYLPFGSPIGPATTGVLTADYPNGADPDTTDVLAVDLTESNGSVVSQSQAIADGFLDPCYVAGAAGSISVPFEVVCPTDVTLTSAEHYSFQPYIRRAVQGTTAMDHPTGMRFGVIDGQVLKVDIPQEWLGKTVYFKFAAYNKLGTQQNQLPDCVAYPFTPSGGPSAEVYVDGVAVSFDDVVSVDGSPISGSTGVSVDGA